MRAEAAECTFFPHALCAEVCDAFLDDICDGSATLDAWCYLQSAREAHDIILLGMSEVFIGHNAGAAAWSTLPISARDAQAITAEARCSYRHTTDAGRRLNQAYALCTKVRNTFLNDICDGLDKCLHTLLRYHSAHVPSFIWCDLVITCLNTPSYALSNILPLSVRARANAIAYVLKVGRL